MHSFRLANACFDVCSTLQYIVYSTSITKSSTLPMTMYSDGTAESSDKGIAQLFNNYFFSVYIQITVLRLFY